MKVSVRLFATLRDRAGSDSIEIEVPEPCSVSDLVQRLTAAVPQLSSSLTTALVAVNQEYAFPNDEVKEGDEIALFPPVSGGVGNYPEYVAVTTDKLNIDRIIAHITIPRTGAVCVFSGAVRGQTSQAEESIETTQLIYDAYRPMAESKLRQVVQEIRQQYPGVQGVAAVQRIGSLQVGETTILIGCSAAHRYDGCFEAARYGIDRVKEIVPVWKKEVGSESEHWVEGDYHPTPADVASKGMAVQGTAPSFRIGCLSCGCDFGWVERLLSCPQCNGPLELISYPSFNPGRVVSTEFSMWRYASMLLPEEVEPVSLGEGWTPLISIMSSGRSLFAKMEMTNPSGSFKDRGAAAMISMLRHHSVGTVHDDSSGNAGAALAAYAARVGIHAKLYVPAYASGPKLNQIRAYGAELIPVDGARSAATEEAIKANNTESEYASHALSPFSINSYRSTAFEIWEQLGKMVPDAVLMPLGQGSQLIGIAQGFKDILDSGWSTKVPRLFGAQSNECAPLHSLLNHQKMEPPKSGDTIAEGIRITDPVRANRVVEMIRSSGGDIRTISDDEIRVGMIALARQGVFVEPTSAVVWPLYLGIKAHLPADSVVVMIVTGSGNKSDLWSQLARQSEVIGLSERIVE